jgi:hypothetical protein
MATKTIKVLKKVERKTFVKGNFVGKYYGDFDNGKTFFNTTKYYDIHIYEGEINNVQIISEDIYEGLDSEIHLLQKQFENVISVTEEKVNNFDAFRFKINDPKVESIQIKHVNKEDNETFGTIVCIVYGYLSDTTDKEEEIEIEVCNSCNNALETCNCKPHIGEDHSRINKNDTILTKSNKRFSYNSNYRDSSDLGCSEVFGWLILIGLGFLFISIIGVPGLIIIASLAAVYFLFYYLPSLFKLVKNISNWLLRLLVNFIILMLGIAIITGIYSAITDRKESNTLEPKKTEQPIKKEYPIEKESRNTYSEDNNISTQLEETATFNKIYTTKSGEKYHRSSCHFLKYSKNEISLEYAQLLGYTACNVCKPKVNVKKPISNSNTIIPKTQRKRKTYNSRKSTASQCTGLTQKGRRCRRRTKNANGRCYQH